MQGMPMSTTGIPSVLTKGIGGVKPLGRFLDQAIPRHLGHDGCQGNRVHGGITLDPGTAGNG